MASHSRSDGAREAQAASRRPRGLGAWMGRVQETRDRALARLTEARVHDLRVALRRCRAMAQALREIEPDAGLRRANRAARDLFRRLSAVREAQVLAGWTKRLFRPGDPIGDELSARLRGEARRELRAARRAIEGFAAGRWRRLRGSLEFRILRRLPAREAFVRVAENRRREALDRHRRAVRSGEVEPWHRLRIAVKRLRYVIENFLPATYARGAAGFRRVQDLLGDLHDLDTLRARLVALSGGRPASDQVRALARVDAERTRRVRGYRALTSGRKSLWSAWRRWIRKSS